MAFSAGRGYPIRLCAVGLMLLMVLSALSVLASPTVGAGTTSAVTVPGTGVVPGYMRFIQVNDFKFDPLAETPSIPEGLAYDTSRMSGPSYFIVQFKGPVTQSMKNELMAAGFTLLHYINYNSFVVRSDMKIAASASDVPSVRWCGVFEPAYKLSPRLSEDYDALVQTLLDSSLAGPSTSDTRASLYAAKSSSSIRVPGAVGAPPGDVAAAFDSNRIAPKTVETSTKIDVVIMTFEKSNVEATAKAVYALGGLDLKFSYKGSGYVVAEVDRNMLVQLARIPGVMWVDRMMEPFVFNDIARWVVQSADGTWYSTPVHDQGVDGTGQTVTVCDTGIDYDHDAFEDPSNSTPGPTHRKVTDYYIPSDAGGDGTDNDINHGTHVSGTVAGDDGTWYVFDGNPTGSNATAGPHDGQAFNALLQVQDVSTDGYYVYAPTYLPDGYQCAMDRDSWIHTNSWGSVGGEYITEAAQTDEFLWNNQEFIVLYAAGNAGSSLYSISPYAVSKNVIAVGATDNGANMDDLASFSSRGPADDGRLKPDVTAPGMDIWSARGTDPYTESDDYWQLSGTSMATPCVAGSVALIRDYFMSGFYPTGVENAVNAFTPSSALVKAVLINGAAEMNGYDAYGNGESWYPNDNQGWGRILLDDGLFFDGDSRGLLVEDNSVGASTGDSLYYNLAIGDTAQPVEITLVWTDYPGTPMTSPNLVNDLDLIVIAPDGTYYLGNNYVGYNPGQSEANPDIANQDRINNVEGVLVLSGLMPGLWTVVVSGYSVPYGPQPFALAMTGGIVTEYGIVSLDSENYQSSAVVSVTVVDVGLNNDPMSVETCTVDMTSTTELSTETVSLTETGADSAIFIGAIGLDNSAVPAPDGLLQVQNGDMIAAAYYDADNGLGSSEWKYDFAAVDDDPPVISGVTVSDVRFSRATISWTTDEASDSGVMYDTSAPPMLGKYEPAMVTSHVVQLTDLFDSSVYYFAVVSWDDAGNLAIDNNGSAYYTFTTPVRPPPPPADEEWPTFHNNVARAGYSPGSMYPPLEERWVTSEDRWGSTWTGPVVKNGILYECTDDGYIGAMDAYSGMAIWSRQLGGAGNLQCVPVVENGVVYATFYSIYGNSTLYALDALTGETIWEVEGSDIGLDFIEWMVLAYSEGMLYGGSYENYVWAIDASNGSLVWTYNASDWLFSGATVNGGQVYMAGYYGYVMALDQYTGAFLWSTYVDGPVSSPPLAAQGALYMGTFAGTMYCLDELTGAHLWSVGGLGFMDYATPAYDGAYIYFGSEDATYCLDANDGTMIWSQGSAYMTSAVVYSNGYVYCACLDGYLRSLDADDGSVADSDYLGTYTQAQPAASEGWVWVADGDGRVHGFGAYIDVGLIVTPSMQSMEVVPDSAADFWISVTNIGVSGPDVFDTSISVGALGWPVELYLDDGITPLSDTDGDLVADTGLIETGNSTSVIIRVIVPAGAMPYDEEISVVIFTSSNDVSKQKNAIVTSTVPPPGVDIWPNGFVSTVPGATVSHQFNITNTGAIEDVFDVNVTATLPWAFDLFASDGITPIGDSDLDGVPDTGPVAGLETTSILLVLTIPADAELGSIDRLTAVVSSSLDPMQTDSASLRVCVPEPVSTLWPTFQHDSARGGVAPEPFDLPLSHIWTSDTTGGGAVYSAPVMIEDKVFFGTYDGCFKAVDAYTGELVWDQYIGEWYYYMGIPAYYDGMVYITYAEESTYLYTISAFDADTGSKIWTRHTVGFCSRSTLVAADGVVYTGDSAGNIYAYDAYDGTELWVYGCGYQIVQGPSLIDGLIVAGSYGSGELFALDLDGNLVWSVMLSQIISAASGGLGMVFVGDYYGTLYALESQTGTTLWSMGGFGMFLFSTPVFCDGMLFVTDYNGRVTCIDALTGSLVWQEYTYTSFYNSPIVNNGVVFAADQYGYLYVRDAATGALLDGMDVSDWWLVNSMALANGYLYFIDDGGYLAAYGFYGVGIPYSIIIEPSPASVPVGGTKVFQASCLDRYGHPVTDATYEWAIDSGEGSLLVLTEGAEQALFLAPLSAGTTVLNVTAGSMSQTVTVDVVHGNAVDLAIAPDELVLQVDEAHTFSVAAWDAFGNEILDITPDWSSTIGSVSPAGEFSAGTVAGSGTVTAAWGSLSAVADVMVLPGPMYDIVVTPSDLAAVVGDVTVLSAVAHDEYGNALSDAVYDWSTDIGSVIALSDSSEAVFSAGMTVGSGTITVSSGSLLASVAVEVAPGALASIAMTPAMVTLSVSDTQQFVVVCRDMFGNEIPDEMCAFSVTGGMGTVTAGGMFTAQSAGSGTVDATSGTVCAHSIVTVASVMSLVLTPAYVTLSVGSTQQFTATCYDTLGAAVPGMTVAFAVHGSVGTISGSGLLTASTEPGDGLVSATVGTLSASSSVTIEPGAVDRLSASPTVVSLAVGSVATITVTAYDEYDNLVQASGCTWSSTVGSVSKSGDGSQAVLYAGESVGTGLVSISLGSENASVSVSVVAGSLAALLVTPTSLFLDSGESADITLQLVDAFGNTVTGEPEWEMQAPSGTILGDLTAGTDGLEATFVAGDAGASGLIVVSIGDITTSVSVVVNDEQSGLVKAAPSLAILALVVGVVALALIAIMLLRKRGPA